MPRTKPSRNPFGTILEKVVTINGKRRTVYDVRKRYPVTGPDGKKTYRDKTKRCYSKVEAQAVLMSLPAEIREKQEADALKAKQRAERAYTFRELVEAFRAQEAKPAVILKGRKVTGYKQDIKNVHRVLDLLADHFGDKPILEITFADLENFRTWYSKRPTARGGLPAIATVNEKMSFLRRLFNFAIQIYWMDVSPFKRGASLIDKAGEAVRNRMLTFEEEKRLLDACGEVKTVTFERRLRAGYRRGEGTETVTQSIPIRRGKLKRLIITALDTAMRRGEIFNLRWGQIDFEKRVIRITGTAAAETKTGQAGVLPMTERLRKVLLEIYDKQKPDAKVFGRYDLRTAFKAACKDAGITDLQFRDLRSTAATRMVLAGNAESQVMKITRHGRLKTFLDHYTNVDERNARTIGASLDDFMEKESEKADAQATAKVEL